MGAVFFRADGTFYLVFRQGPFVHLAIRIVLQQKTVFLFIVPVFFPMAKGHPKLIRQVGRHARNVVTIVEGPCQGGHIVMPFPHVVALVTGP